MTPPPYQQSSVPPRNAVAVLWNAIGPKIETRWTSSPSSSSTGHELPLDDEGRGGRSGHGQ